MGEAVAIDWVDSFQTYKYAERYGRFEFVDPLTNISC